MSALLNLTCIVLAIALGVFQSYRAYKTLVARGETAGCAIARSWRVMKSGTPLAGEKTPAFRSLLLTGRLQAASGVAWFVVYAALMIWGTAERPTEAQALTPELVTGYTLAVLTLCLGSVLRGFALLAHPVKLD